MKVHKCYAEERDYLYPGLSAICAETFALGGSALYHFDGFWKGEWPDTTAERAAAFLGLVCDAEHVLA